MRSVAASVGFCPHGSEGVVRDVLASSWRRGADEQGRTPAARELLRMSRAMNKRPRPEAVPDPGEVAALARRLLDAVERGDLVADDAAGRRVVALWRVLAGGRAPIS
jgi:hypothetical protein